MVDVAELFTYLLIYLSANIVAYVNNLSVKTQRWPHSK